MLGLVKCCFTPAETVRLIRDGEPRTATSTFTQLLGSVLQCCFTATETIQYKLLGTGAQDVHLDCHLTPGLCSSVLLYGHGNRRLIKDREPRTAISTFTQFLSSDGVGDLGRVFLKSHGLSPCRFAGVVVALFFSLCFLLLFLRTKPSVFELNCCFTSAESVRTIRDGEPRTSASTFTQLLSSVADSSSNVALRPQRAYGLSGTGSSGRPPRLSHSS